MNFSDLIINRFSVRSYTSDPISEEIILKILDAGRMAPSAVNYQPWHFVAVNDKLAKIGLQEAYPREWFAQAPLYVVICADYRNAWVRKSDDKNFADIDASIAIDHIVLQATELGIGTCWVCNFDVSICKNALSIPDLIEPLAIISLGYSNEIAKTKLRKPIEEVVHWNKF